MYLSNIFIPCISPLYANPGLFALDPVFRIDSYSGRETGTKAKDNPIWLQLRHRL